MVTFEEVNALLRYDPSTGLVYWRVNRRGSHRVKAGDVAGSVTASGHIRIGVKGHRFLAHVLAWLLMTGAWPSDEIDHEDGNGANNKWGNLRVAGRLGNAKNRKVNANNTSGFKGVSRWKEKWKAEIMADGVSHYLGVFETPQAAHEAYLAASRQLHGQFARVA